MSKILLHRGAWAALALLADPATLPAGSTIKLTDSRLRVGIVLDEQPRNFAGSVDVGLAAWDADAKRWFAVDVRSVSFQAPQLEAGAFTVVFGERQIPSPPASGAPLLSGLSPPEGLPSGVYALLLLSDGVPGTPLAYATPYTPAGSGSGGGGGFGGGAAIEEFLTADGRNAMANLTGVVKAWTAIEQTYAGAFAKLPRPTNLSASFTADYDGKDITVTGNRFGKAVQETFPASPGKTVIGKVVFDEVSGQSRAMVGTKGSSDLGYGAQLGLGKMPQGAVGMLLVDDVLAPRADYSLDAAQGAIILAAGKEPDGKREFRVIY